MTLTVRLLHGSYAMPSYWQPAVWDLDKWRPGKLEVRGSHGALAAWAGPGFWQSLVQVPQAGIDLEQLPMPTVRVVSAAGPGSCLEPCSCQKIY